MRTFQQTFTKEIHNHFVYEAYKKIAEYYFYIGSEKAGTQKLGIKIYETLDNKFSYDLSHFYHGSKQASPYVSSIMTGFNTVEEALYKAKGDLFSFYDPKDELAQWVENTNF